MNNPFDTEALRNSYFYLIEAGSQPATCDGCLNKARYQTTGSDDIDYYACKDCVNKYNLRVTELGR